MNNIIYSQLFVCKRRIVSVLACLLSALLILAVGFLITENSRDAISQFGMFALFVIIMLPILPLSFCYCERIQMYEIMAGYRPHQIILGRTAVCLPFTIVILAVCTVICLLGDNSIESVQRLMLYWILAVRATLCIVFLSPLLKESVFVPLFSVMLMMIHGSDMEALSHSPISFLCFAQCTLLGLELTAGFMIKVIASSVISCVIYYIIGYMTLKKKFDLEPHPLS